MHQHAQESLDLNGYLDEPLELPEHAVEAAWRKVRSVERATKCHLINRFTNPMKVSPVVELQDVIHAGCLSLARIVVGQKA